MLSIGIGLWKPDPRGRGFWRRFARALRLERKEAADLAKTFFQPKGAKLVLEILHHLAMIDLDLDEREKSYIERFARAWRIDYEVEDLTADESSRAGSHVALRASVVAYLAIAPPKNKFASCAKRSVNSRQSTSKPPKRNRSFCRSSSACSTIT